MYYLKRPTPLTCTVAGVLLGVGFVNVIARAIHNFTPIKMVEPFAGLTFILAVVCTAAGGVFSAYLANRYHRQKITALSAELAEERMRRLQFEVLLTAIQETDARVEVNGVRLLKLQQELREHIAGETTHPIVRLHSINGGGGA